MLCVICADSFSELVCIFFSGSGTHAGLYIKNLCFLRSVILSTLGSVVCDLVLFRFKFGPVDGDY